jgi:hypothetical protein
MYNGFLKVRDLRKEKMLLFLLYFEARLEKAPYLEIADMG